MKYESLGQITNCWVGQDKQGRYKIGLSWQRAQSNPRTRPGWTYCRGAARDSRSSMYKLHIDNDVCDSFGKKRKKIKILCIACMTHLLFLYDWFVYFLRRLKINYDSHEVILEFGTVANSDNIAVVKKKTTSGVDSAHTALVNMKTQQEWAVQYCCCEKEKIAGVSTATLLL